jgi:hypothetical protein
VTHGVTLNSRGGGRPGGDGGGGEGMGGDGGPHRVGDILTDEGETGAARSVREAVTRAIRMDGVRTEGLGGPLGMAGFTEHLATPPMAN